MMYYISLVYKIKKRALIMLFEIWIFYPLSSPHLPGESPSRHLVVNMIYKSAILSTK